LHFFGATNFHAIFLRIRVDYADQLFASATLYVNENPLKIATGT